MLNTAYVVLGVEGGGNYIYFGQYFFCIKFTGMNSLSGGEDRFCFD